MKKSYALIGAGSRAFYMFALPMVSNELNDHVNLCGVYDINPKRSELLSEACGGVAVYDSFEALIAGARPDTVVVASTDSTHHLYIIAALEAGCDVITEKPMTTTSPYAAAILDAEQRTGKRVTVTFNLRFAPYFARVKELIQGGAIGDVHHIALEWYLDRRHGADYFRRWHAEMDNSGGLLVHKSTHHFDIMNWWLDSRPAEVHAYGGRRFYGPTREERGERCLTCEYKDSCEFYLDLHEHPFMDSHFLQVEDADGYIRDRCVFHERIDIYDQMSVQVQYDSGALLSYSLVAFSPDEGWRATVTGSEGKLELANLYSNADMQGSASSEIRLIRPGAATQIIEIDTGADGHGGGDIKLRSMLFKDAAQPDPLGQQAGSEAGALSMLIGAAANLSIEERRPVPIRELISSAAVSAVRG
ncbi:Gfo/Idh/MocA family oxidoreductase [Paenibacillus daejeonensis]|uniref:Gfo/Idh/MocA family oxidoreductase n=1 Tax=Paenibacillus daejeonensis TaxID=135193 RepID=UPI00037E1053|nr:Gfo/Idh/MocA family oxidoreductase [Paenibacillus daejeonensis]